MAKPVKRIYPHVDQIKDTPTQQTIRLLWEKIFGLQANLNTAQSTIDTLQGTVDDHSTSISDINGQITHISSPAGQAISVAISSGGASSSSGGGSTSPPSNHPDHTDVVAQAITDLTAALISLSGPCGAFEVVKLVAWRLMSSEPDISLIAKGGTNCNGYSIDAIMYSDGSVWDMLGDAGGANNPQWTYVGQRPTTDARPPIPPSI